uniref:Casc1 domain-containing protein n=1 Tax=Glossina austeni TaxID=7395 RepID=A0A1A9UGQ2_GLOAU
MKNPKEKNSKPNIRELEAIIMSRTPHHLEADEYPDVYAKFLETEQTKFEDFLSIAYDPITLNIDSDDINLRIFVIVGGAYQVNFAQKPLNVKIGNIGMTWQCAERKLIIEKDIGIDEPSPSGFDSVIGTRNCLNCDEFLSPIDIVKTRVDPTHPLFVLVFHVPEYLCYWGEPIACHYEEIQEIVNIENLENRKSKEDFINLIDISHAQTTLRNKLEVEKLDKQNETLIKSHRINLHCSRPNNFEYRNINSTSLPNLPDVVKLLDYHMDSPLTAE